MRNRNRKVDKSKLIELLDSGHSLNACAKFFNVRLTAIQQWVKRHKLKVSFVFGRLTPVERNLMLKMAANGVPYREIARQFNMRHDTLKNRITFHKSKGTTSPYAKKGQRKNYGMPVPDGELVEYAERVKARLTGRKPGVPADHINDAVNLALIDMRSRPAVKNWRGMFFMLAGRRLVDVIREQLGKSGHKQKIAYTKTIEGVDCQTNVGDEWCEDVEALTEAIKQLPARQRRVMQLYLKHQDWNIVAEKMKISVSNVFIIRREAIEGLKCLLNERS